MGGEDHPQGAVRAARRGAAPLLWPMSACHQPHQELLGPGHSKSRGDALVPGAEMGQAQSLLTEPWGSQSSPAPLHCLPAPLCSPLWPGGRALLLCGFCHLEHADRGQWLQRPHCPPTSPHRP